MTLFDYNKGLPNSVRYDILQRKLKNGIKLEGWEYDIDSTCIVRVSPDNHKEAITDSISTFQFILLFIFTILFFAIWDMMTK